MNDKIARGSTWSICFKFKPEQGNEYFYNVDTGAFGYIDLEGNAHDA